MQTKKTKIVVFTDLDGSLLNEKYQYSEVKAVVDKLLALDAAVVFCSSKTRAEILPLQIATKISDPFIAENGSAIFIPKGYFQTSHTYTKSKGRFEVIELGVRYSTIRKKLAYVKAETGARIVGFGDLTVEELAKDAHLPLYAARLAKKREYDEPFRLVFGKQDTVLRCIEKQGLRCVAGGRYLHAFGDTDKGKATAILRDLYAEEYPKLLTAGVGNSQSDFSMLEYVDAPFLVEENLSQSNICATWKKVLQFVQENNQRPVEKLIVSASYIA